MNGIDLNKMEWCIPSFIKFKKQNKIKYKKYSEAKPTII